MLQAYANCAFVGLDPACGFLFRRFRDLKKKLKYRPDLVDTVIAFLVIAFVIVAGTVCNNVFPDKENPGIGNIDPAWGEERNIYQRCLVSNPASYCEESYGYLKNE